MSDKSKIEWTDADTEEINNFILQIEHIGCLDSKQKQRFVKLIMKATKILDAARISAGVSAIRSLDWHGSLQQIRLYAAIAWKL